MATLASSSLSSSCFMAASSGHRAGEGGLGPNLDGLRSKSLPPLRLEHLFVSTPRTHLHFSPSSRSSLRTVRMSVAAAAATDVPTVSETKLRFLNKFRKPIPSIYSNVIQELLVQQHLMRYNKTYQYDAVFALGFVAVYDQLIDGYPNVQDQEAIFKAYIEALNEDPEQYRSDAKKLEEWASTQTAQSIIGFQNGNGEVESILKDISERAGGKGNFHYSRFFAIGLFRLIEKAKATDPVVLEKLAKALNVSKLSVDRDLDVYRNLLSKLAQAKELLKEYIEREKKKQAERQLDSKAPAASTKIEANTE